MLTRATKRLPDPAAIALEPIAENPIYRAALTELEALEARLGQALERRRAKARLMGAKPGRSTLERAKDLVASGKIDPTDPADDIAATAEEEQILRQAIIAKTGELDRISADLSFEVSQKFQPLHNQALLAVLTAIDDLAAALDAAAAIRARLWFANYVPRSVILPQLAPEGALVLDSSTNVGSSPAWYFRRELERRGIL
jgi:hypothetical protein